ncbi:MAG: hypothetical protein JWQ19_985 [Subtercola sp.]|nr:hypothetical protein [Subtercola sp.]
MKAGNDDVEPAAGAPGGGPARPEPARPEQTPAEPTRAERSRARALQGPTPAKPAKTSVKTAAGPRAWAVAHFATAARLSAGRRPNVVAVADSRLAEPFTSVEMRSYRPGTESARAVIVYFPASAELESLRHRAGEWLCGSLAQRLGVIVVRVAVGSAVVDVNEAAYQAVRWAAAEHPNAPLAVLGAADGGSLAARAAMIARDENSRDELRRGPGDTPTATPHLVRQALIAPDFSLIAGPPATAEALVTSLVARLSELPPTLVQRQATSAQLADENLAVLLREAGVAVREIEYPPTTLSWASYPRAVAYSGRALADLEGFFRRGLIDDGFDIVPAWNVH